MSLELATMIKDLVATNPQGTDPKSQGDDHLRLIKSVLQSQFSGFTEGLAITRTETQLNNAMVGLEPNILEANMDDLALLPGAYQITADGTGKLPIQSGGHILYAKVATNNQAWRFFFANSNGLLYYQLKTSGVWGAWRALQDGRRAWGSAIGGRVLGTTYTNTTPQDMEVKVGVNFVANASIEAFVGGFSIGAQGYLNAGQVAPSIGFTVPPGVTYRVTSNGTLLSWWELRHV